MESADQGFATRVAALSHVKGLKSPCRVTLIILLLHMEVLRSVPSLSRLAEIRHTQPRSISRQIEEAEKAGVLKRASSPGKKAVYCFDWQAISTKLGFPDEAAMISGLSSLLKSPLYNSTTSLKLVKKETLLHPETPEDMYAYFAASFAKLEKAQYSRRYRTASEDKRLLYWLLKDHGHEEVRTVIDYMFTHGKRLSIGPLNVDTLKTKYFSLRKKALSVKNSPVATLDWEALAGNQEWARDLYEAHES